jgi:thiaminase/transcriptional activator TenA
MLKDRLRQALLDRAQSGSTTTYRELAQRLGLVPPHTIHRVTEALERLMEEDVAAARPMLSALCVSKVRPGIPARGFFLVAKGLGAFGGDPSGPEARDFHAHELQRVLSFYGTVQGSQDRDQTRQGTMSFFERLKAEASAEWRAYTEHPFTTGMADGSLPEAAFRHYLVQDYLFLIEFARAYALSVYKSPSVADMREGAAGLSAILDVEMDLHVKLCAGWGLSPGDLERAPPAAEMLAYTRYVLDAGMRGDLLALKVALAPCVIGYAEIATRLAMQPDAHAATNPYRVWIAEYAGAPYQEVAAKARAQLDHLADLYVTPAREAELTAIFREATRLEADFWAMGWRMGSAIGDEDRKAARPSRP